MRLRRGTTEAGELEGLEERLTNLVSEIEQAEAALEQATASVASATRLAATAHLDGGDIAAATAARQEAEALTTALAGSLEVLHEAQAELDRRLDAKRAEVRVQRRDAAQAELEHGQAAQAAASERVSVALVELIGAKDGLVRAREHVKALRAKVAELDGDQFAESADESEWPDGVSDLVEFLTGSKPLRPLAEREQSMRREEVDAANAVARERVRVLDEVRRFALQSWSRPGEQEAKVEQYFAQVPPGLLEEARALYEQERAALLRRSPAMAR